MERPFVRWLTDCLPPHERLIVGIGDDAAVLRLSGECDLVATTDMLMDGVDFELAHHEPERIGRKALAVNLSDLAAMAARPVAALVSLALPRQGGQALAQRLLMGMEPLAAELDCPIAGGDTNSWNERLVISVTALGEVRRKCQWTRSGAKPGDAVVVSGHFGGSILGRHFDFMPRVREALWLAQQYEVHAAMDVSDGLSLDLARLCEVSQCGAVLDAAQVPISPSAHELAKKLDDGVSALDHALADGEDFELVLAMPPSEAARLVEAQPLKIPWTRIGTIVTQAGLSLIDGEGRQAPLTPRGYEHRLDG